MAGDRGYKKRERLNASQASKKVGHADAHPGINVLASRSQQCSVYLSSCTPSMKLMQCLIVNCDLGAGTGMLGSA